MIPWWEISGDARLNCFVMRKELRNEEMQHATNKFSAPNDKTLAYMICRLAHHHFSPRFSYDNILSLFLFHVLDMFFCLRH